MEWETIDNYTQRAQVLGGWIVKVVEDVFHHTEDRGFQSGWDYRIAVVFVPDVLHMWNPEDYIKRKEEK
jgi:hypothetical protein